MQVTFLTSPELLDRKWEDAAQLLAPVVHEAARGEFTLADLRAMTQVQRVNTALVECDGEPRLAMVFEFVHYPQTLAVNVMAVGGRGLDESIGAFWPTFCDWARQAGASVIEASCSDAMARLLGRYGFSTTYRVVRCAL